MDIQYLLFLQNIRETYVPFLIPFMEMVSYFAISYILFIPAYIYWVKDKKAGHYILAVWSVANALNATVKLTACVYRPWIRDPRVVPAGNAIATAAGVGLYWVIAHLRGICIDLIGANGGRVAHSFLLFFYIIVLVPFILKKSAEPKQETAE